ncbi:hypothetical protein NDU88_001461 [Pleurodeles waltl]|uniref:Secreted protein n=1 Tax=Pleurodeles waltl TaxID=8319 RepID=A0AAV7UUR3_PLEWA|nr:hypothetical protein NDU88_001461 [Pleurodeles waltl]
MAQSLRQPAHCHTLHPLLWCFSSFSAPSGPGRTFSSGGAGESALHTPPLSKSTAAPSVGGEASAPHGPLVLLFVGVRSPGPQALRWAESPSCGPSAPACVEPASRRLSPHDRQGRLVFLLFFSRGAAPQLSRPRTSSPPWGITTATRQGLWPRPAPRVQGAGPRPSRLRLLDRRCHSFTTPVWSAARRAPTTAFSGPLTASPDRRTWPR